MGRGKIEIKKIENAPNRLITFSKRRGGLVKKAHELAVLCDAEVALIMFSSTGKLFEFTSSRSMRKFLERYWKSTEGPNFQNLLGDENEELIELKVDFDHLQQIQRHLTGEDLSTFSMQELQQLEQQLEWGLRNVRVRKDQLLTEQLEELQTKASVLHKENEMLRKQITEVEETAGVKMLSTSACNTHLSLATKETGLSSPPCPPPYGLPSLNDSDDSDKSNRLS